MTKPASTESPDVRHQILMVGQRIMSGKGYSAVGLNEILTAANVPKGSFYHYFGSKDAFGVAMLSNYFDEYLAELDSILGQPGLSMAQRLVRYFDHWRNNQSFLDCQGKCLAVKLAAEVADLSEPMRAVLQQGTAAIIARLTAAIAAGVAEGSLTTHQSADATAAGVYQLWLGASVMVKIVRDTTPFDAAMTMTRQLLQPVL